MEFSLTKKGYSPKEVDEYIAAMKREYESTVIKQRDRIKQMLDEAAESEKELAAYRAKSSQISKAIVSAVAKAEEIERLSRIKYNQEISRLKAFHEKWTAYYDKILDEYPLDARLAKAGEFNRRMDKILSRVENDETAAGVAGDVDVKPPVKPEGDEVRIGYISVKADDAVGDTGINDLLPDADPDSPIRTGNFDPMERIGRYFAAEREKQENAEKAAAARKTSEKRVYAEKTVAASGASGDYADRSPSGFSFEEALNPTEDLEDILKDLGLFSCD